MNFIKKNLKVIIVFIITASLASGVCFATTYNYFAKDISYTKTDGTKISVENALNDLYSELSTQTKPEIIKTTPVLFSGGESYGEYSGEVIGNLNSTAYDRNMYQIFDKQYTARTDGYQHHGAGNLNTGVTATSCWVGFHFTDTSLKVFKWSVCTAKQPRDKDEIPSKVQLWASNTGGDDYVPISNVESVSTSTDLNTYYIDNCKDSYTYLIVKIIEAGNQSNVCIDEIEFYGY